MARRITAQNPADHAKRVTNILGIFAQANAAEKQDGMTWYAAANSFAKGLALKNKIGTNHAAGIIAALSPQISWERNMVIAELAAAGRTYSGAYDANKAKAKAIRKGEEPLDVLGGPKVRAFFECIAHPESAETVCVDRHAFDIAEGGYDNKEQDRRLPLARKGVYESIAAAYVSAAHVLGIRPHQAQAVTWLAWRALKKGAWNLRLDLDANVPEDKGRPC